ncbi:MAG: hypothetical protein Q8P18_00240 [Pseudomonadota bacterium]|nr:hypothetical protein [Pseudomonadota bacterium]
MSISLTTPTDGAGSYDGSMDLAWTVSGIELDPDALGGEAVDGRGHVHVYIDGELFEESADTAAQITGLREGPHTLLVRLAGNDHHEFDARDSVEVEAAFPTVDLVSPADGAALVASSVPLAVVIGGFTLRDAIGSEDVFGQGHFTISVDGQVRDWGVDPTLALATGLTEGEHTIRVDLVGNDGQKLDPPVYSESRVEVLRGVRGVYFDRSAFGAPYDSATLPLALSTSAFLLVASDGTLPAVEGEGHLHLFMDGLWLDRTWITSLLLQNVPPGPHVFEARLVSNDGFELPVVDRLRVMVPDDRPDALITYPGPRWRMGSSFDLSFQAENFTLDAGAMDTENALHVGHAQVWVDGLLLHEDATGFVPVTGLAVGSHWVRVQLANNDRTPVSPAVYQEIEVIVE